MQLLVDFFPIIVFFGVYQLADIYAATGALILAMALQIGYEWWHKRTVSKMLLISGALVAVFGGATLLLQDRLFIQWKPTIVNWLFAGGFLASQFIGNRTLIERVMGHAVSLEATMWRQLNVMWIGNFTFLGAANLFVVYNFDEATWVNFKLFGMLGLTLAMAIGQAIWISSRADTEQHEPGESQN